MFLLIFNHRKIIHMKAENEGSAVEDTRIKVALPKPYSRAQFEPPEERCSAQAIDCSLQYQYSVGA